MSLWEKVRLARQTSLKLFKPIFLVGCGKSGTTVAGLLFAYHPQLGPRAPQQSTYTDLQQFIDAILRQDVHGSIANDMECKDIWDRYFPINVDLRIGKELELLQNPLNEPDTRHLISELTKDFREDRYFSKQPFNSFRVHVLREIFPDAKILAIHRDGRDVISSWGRLHDRWETFGGINNAITVLAAKWNETIDHIEKYKQNLGIETFKYEDLVCFPETTMERLCKHCEIPYLQEIYDGVRLENRIGVWRNRLEARFHEQLNRATSRNLKTLGYID